MPPTETHLSRGISQFKPVKRFTGCTYFTGIGHLHVKTQTHNI
jgi:hypothetical protein